PRQRLHVEDRLAVGICLQAAVGREPGIEQARALQRRLDAGALAVCDRRSEFDQLPQRCTRAVGADLRINGIWRGPPPLHAALQASALVLQRRALAFQFPTSSFECHAAFGGSHVVLPLRSLEEAARRVVAVERTYPLG